MRKSTGRLRLKSKRNQMEPKWVFFIVSAHAELTLMSNKIELKHRSALKCFSREVFCPALT